MTQEHVSSSDGPVHTNRRDPDYQTHHQFAGHAHPYAQTDGERRGDEHYLQYQFARYYDEKIDTSVALKSGSSVLLGGLIQNQVSNNVSKVPGLGDVPLLGQLFKTTSVGTTRMNSSS